VGWGWVHLARRSLFSLLYQPRMIDDDLSIYLSIYLWLYSPCVLWQLFQFFNLHTVGRTPWTGDQPVARLLPTHRTTQTQNKRIQTSMPRVRFEPTIPVFEREDSSCLRSSGYYHRRHSRIHISKAVENLSYVKQPSVKTAEEKNIKATKFRPSLYFSKLLILIILRI
jgi:hypothetical protein